MSHVNKPIKVESIKLQPNHNFVVFDLSLYIYRFYNIFCHVFCFTPKLTLHKINVTLKGAATAMRYFARSKLFRSYVPKKIFSLI